MKSNLSKMAFASFQKKAHQLRANLKKGNGSTISLRDLCSKDDQIYLWSWEKGFEFMNINLSKFKPEQPLELGFIIATIMNDHLDKKDDAFLPTHVGVYNEDKKELIYYSIIRISDIVNGGTKESDALLEVFRYSAEIDSLQKMIEE